MHFPHYGRIGLGRYRGVIVARPHETLSGEHCNIHFDSRKYRASDCETFWHSDTPEVAGGITWGNSLARITTVVTLEAVDGGERFTVLNTHLHSNDPYVHEAGTRMGQMKARTKTNFHDAIAILDAHHAMEHLAEFCSLFKKEAREKVRYGDWREMMLDGDTRQLLHEKKLSLGELTDSSEGHKHINCFVYNIG